MNIAIVGSRTFQDYNLLEMTVDKLIKERGFTDITIISGGARGADTLAEFYAQQKGYKKKIYEADWSIGKSAGPIRNKQIVENSDIVVAFRKPGSKGTQSTIDIAKRYPVELIVIHV